MPDEVNGSDLTFKSRIEMDFTNAKANAESFKTILDAVSDPILKLGGATKGMAMGVVDRLEKELTALSNQNWKPVAVKVSLKERIEEAVRQALLSKNFIVASDASDNNIVVTLESEHWRKATAKFRDSLAKAMSNVEIDEKSIAMKPVKLSEGNLEELSTKFNQRLAEAFDKRVQFDWDGVDPKDPKFKLMVKPEHISAMVQSVQSKMEEILRSPEFTFIDTKNIKKPQVDKEKVQKMLDDYAQKVQAINAQLEDVDISKWAGFPKIGEGVKEFAVRVSKIIAEINNIQTEIKKIEFSEADVNAMTVLRKSIASLRMDTVSALTQTINKIKEAVNKPFDKKTDAEGFKAYQESIAQVDKLLNTVVTAKLNAVSKQLLESVGVVETMVGGTPVYATTVKEVQEKVMTAIQQVKESMSKSNGLDTDETKALKSALDSLSAQLNQNLVRTMQESFDIAGDSILAGIGKAFEAVNKQIVESTAKMELKVTESSWTVVPLDFSTMAEAIKPQLAEIYKLMVANTIPVSEGAGATVQVGIPAEQMASMREAVQANLEAQVKSQLEQSGVKMAVDNQNYEDLKNSVVRGTNDIINAIVIKTNQAISAMHENLGTYEFDDTAIKELSQRALEVARTFTNQFTQTLNSVVENAVFAQNFQETLSASLEQDIRAMMEKASVQSSQEQLVMDLNGIVREASFKITEALRLSIADWVPQVGDINVAGAVEKLQTAMQEIVGNLNFTGDMTTQLDDAGKIVMAKIEAIVQQSVAEWNPVTAEIKPKVKSLVDKVKLFAQELVDNAQLPKTPKMNLNDMYDSFIYAIRGHMYQEMDKWKPSVYPFDVPTDTLMGKIKVAVEQALDEMPIRVYNYVDLSEALQKTVARIEKELLRVIKEVDIQATQLIVANLDPLIKKINADLKARIAETQPTVNQEINLNLDPLIRRIIPRIRTAIEEAITAWTPTAPEFTFSLNNVVRPVQTTVRGALEELGARISEGIQTQLGAIPTVTPGMFNVAPLIERFQEAFGRYTTQFVDMMSNAVMVPANEFAVPTNALHPDVRRALAEAQGLTVPEYRENFPTLMGQGDLNEMMAQNIAVIMRRFHQAMQQNTNMTINEYQQAMRNVEVEPNVEAIIDFADRLTRLQNEVIRRARQVVDAQFNAIYEQIRTMEINPRQMPFNANAGQPNRAQARAVNQMAQAQAQAGATAPRAQAVANAGAGQAVAYTRGTGNFGVPNQNVRNAFANGGNTHSFMGSVVNTMRYITANWMMTVPMELFQLGMEQATKFESLIAQSEQNLLAKDRDMKDVAQRRVQARYENRDKLGSLGIAEDVYNDPAKRSQIERQEAEQLKWLSKRGAVRQLQNLAIAYGGNLEDVGTAWQISTRTIDDPYEAMALTRNAMRIHAYEPGDITAEDSARGLEAIKSQWQLRGGDMEDVSNMVIKTASTYASSSKDILDTLSKSGSAFAENLPGMSKKDALATSMVFSALFTQATAKSGNEAGTFWRTVFQSPFGANESKMLEDVAKSSGLTQLNPYVTQNGARTQKNGAQMFLDIASAKGKLDDASWNMLMDTLYKKRGEAYASAIQAMLEEDIPSLESKVGGTGISLQERVKEIVDVSKDEIMSIIGGRMDTFEFKKQRASTMWQVTSYEVFDNLKGEISTVLTYLTAFMRVLKNNADKIASLINTATAIALGYGARWLGNRLVARGEQARAGELESIREGASRLKEEREARINRGATQAGANLTASQQAQLAREQVAVAGQGFGALNGGAGMLLNPPGAMNDPNVMYVPPINMLNAPPSALAELSRQSSAVINLRNAVVQLGAGMAQLGVQEAEFQNMLRMLNQGVISGVFPIEQMENEIRLLGNATGATEQQINELNLAIRQISASFEGLTVAERQARMTNLASTFGINQPAQGGNGLVPVGQTASAGSGTGTAVMGTLLATTALRAGRGATTGGLLSRAWGWLRGAGGAVAGSTAVRGATSLIGGITGMATGLGEAYLIGKAIEAVANPLMSMGLSDSERMEATADSRRSLAMKVNNIANSGVGGKLLGGLGLGVNFLTDAVSSIFGKGTHASISDYGKAWQATGITSEQERMKYLEDTLHYQADKNLALGKQADEYEDYYAQRFGLDLYGNGLGKETRPINRNPITTVKEAQQLTGYIDEFIKRKMGTSESKFNIDRAGLLLEGYREDSLKVRNLLKEFLSGNIQVLEDALKQVNEQLQLMKPGSAAYEETQKYAMGLQQQIADAKLKQLTDVIMKGLEESRGSYDRQSALNKADSTIAKAKATLAGYSEGSQVMKALEIAELQKDNQNISKLIAEYTDQLTGLKGKDREDTLIKIKDLEAQSADNLTKIYKQMTSQKATFNLPDGITPVTYWEAVAGKSTNKNVTMRSGDVTVNINVASMSGSAEDVQRVADAVQGTIRNTQADLADLLARSARNGTQYGIPNIR